MRALPLLVLVFAAASCMKAPDPDAYRQQQMAAAHSGGGQSQPQAPGNAPAFSTPGGEKPAFSIDPVDGWTEIAPKMNFYLAQYQLPESGSCTLSYGVGGMEDNLSRWLGQFEVASGDPRGETEAIHVEGAHHTTVLISLKGTFTATRSIGGGEPRENWMLLGSIHDTPAGDVFLKAVGPQSELEAKLDEFKQMAASLKIEP